MCRQKAEAAADVQGGKSGKTQLPLPSLSSFLSPFLSDRTNGHFAARITVIIAIENSKVCLACGGHFFLPGEEETPGVSEGAGITPPSSSGQA